MLCSWPIYITMKTSILVYLLFLGVKFSCVYGYRDGARDNSCYNHTIDHGAGSFLLDCDPTSCRYFLIIKEVVNETTLQLGNETEYYECGKIYGVEVANSLNDPEGFLVQARSGTEDSSEIIGTFVDPSVVATRNPSIPVNYKILECWRNQSAGPELYPNSATHPDTVNNAGILQLFWRAPDCTEETLPNVTMWFTIAQQLLIGYHPAKNTTLTYIPPPVVPTSSSTVLFPSSTVPFPSSTVPFPSSAITSLLPNTMIHAMTTPIPELSPQTSKPMLELITTQMQSSPASTQNQTDGSRRGLSQEEIIGLGAGAGAGLLVLIIIIVITIVICKKVFKKTKSADKPPLTSESSEVPVETMSYSKLTKEHEENDHGLFNGGNEENSYTCSTFKQPNVIENEYVGEP